MVKYIFAYRKSFFPWFLALIFVFYQFILQVSPSAMKDILGVIYHANTAQIGTFSAVFYYAFSAALLPFGYFMDIKNKKYLFILGLFLCSSGCLFIVFSHSLIYCDIGRIFMGVGGSSAFVGSMGLASDLFPKDIIGVLSGVTITAAMLGAIFGQQLLYFLMHILGYQNTFLLLSSFGFFLCVLWYAIPLEYERKDKEHDVINNILKVVRNKTNWKSSFYAGLIYISLPTFAGLWAPRFLIQTGASSYEQALKISSFVWFGMAVGGPLFGLIADKIKNYRSLMFISGAAISLIFFLFIFELVKTVLYLKISFLLIGFFCGSYTIPFIVIRNVNCAQNSSLVVSFAMSVIMLISAIATQGFGYITEFLSYSQGANFKVAMLLFPFFSIMSVMLSCFLTSKKALI